MCMVGKHSCVCFGGVVCARARCGCWGSSACRRGWNVFDWSWFLFGFGSGSSLKCVFFYGIGDVNQICFEIKLMLTDRKFQRVFEMCMNFPSKLECMFV